jgi:hypothetical protein
MLAGLRLKIFILLRVEMGKINADKYHLPQPFD